MADQREQCPLPPNAAPVRGSDKAGKGATKPVPPKIPPRPGRQDETISKRRVLSHSLSVTTEPSAFSKRSKLTKTSSLSTSALPDSERRLLEEPLESSRLSEMTLQQLAADFSQSFPLRIKVLDGYSGPSSEVTISTADFYDVHFLKTQKVVVARDSLGEAYTIPLNTPLQFGLLYSADMGKKQNEEKIYAKVSDILALTPLPRVICATKKYDGTDKSGSVDANEILVVNRSIKPKLLGKKSVEVLSLRTKSKKVLSYECEGMFSLSPSKVQLYLPEITQCIDDPFPCLVLLESDQLSTIPQYVPHSSLSGTVTLTEVKTQASLIVSPVINYNDPEPSSTLTGTLELPVDGTLSMVKVTIVRKFEQQAEGLTNETKQLNRMPDLSHTMPYPAAEDDEGYSVLQGQHEDYEYVTVHPSAVVPPKAVKQESQWRGQDGSSTRAEYDTIEYHSSMYATTEFKPSHPSLSSSLPVGGAITSPSPGSHSSKPMPLPRTQLPLQSSRKQEQMHSSPTMPSPSPHLLRQSSPHARVPMETHHSSPSSIRASPLPLPRRQSTDDKDESALTSPSESISHGQYPSNDTQPSSGGTSGTANCTTHDSVCSQDNGTSLGIIDEPHYMRPCDIPLPSYSTAASIPEHPPEPHYMRPKPISTQNYSTAANIPEHLDPPEPHYMRPRPHIENAHNELSSTPLYSYAYELSATRDRSIEYLTNALQALNAHVAKIKEDVESIKQRIDPLEERLTLLEGAMVRTPSKKTDIKHDATSSAQANCTFLGQLDVQGVQRLLQAMNLTQYQSSFAMEQVCGMVLSQCSEDMLRDELGVDKKLHLKRLAMVISGQLSARDILGTP